MELIQLIRQHVRVIIRLYYPTVQLYAGRLQNGTVRLLLYDLAADLDDLHGLSDTWPLSALPAEISSSFSGTSLRTIE